MSEMLALLEADYPFLLFSIILVFGLLIGSFLNVVIHRVPIMMEREWKMQANEILENAVDEPTATFNLILPNSHCPGCQTEIKPWQNIPVISFLLLRGKCAQCSMKISARYPVIELATGILTVVTFAHFGVNWTGLMAAIFTWSLISLAMIDYDTRLLPDDITLPLLWLGLIVASLGMTIPLPDALWGAVIGYGVLWMVFWGFKLVTGKDGMGYGDFKLLGMLGAWMGWQTLPLIIILSSMAGAVVGGSLIALGRARDNPIPFGPYLAIAGWITLIWGDQLISSYLATVG